MGWAEAPTTGDSVAGLTDSQLWNAQLLLELACGRRRSAITRKRENYFCFLARVLKVEADLRGLPSPSDHPYVADLRA